MGKSKSFENIDIHRFADRTRPHSHQMYRGAFRITPQSLRSFQSIFDQATGTSAKSTWMVFSAKDEPKTVQNLDDVLAMRNPQGNPIWGLFLNHVGADVNNRLFITSADIRQFAAIQFSADGESPDKVSAMIGKVRDETKNIRLWYWPFRWADDFVLLLAWTHGKAIALVLVAICFAALLVGGIGQVIVEMSHSAGTPQKAVTTTQPQESEKTPPKMTEQQKAALEAEIKRLQEEASQKAREQAQRERKEALSQLWRTLMWGGAGGAVLVSFLFARLLFPRAVFEIGEGKERYQRLSTIRTFLIGTLLLSGILIPWMRTYIIPNAPSNGSATASQPRE